MSLTSPSPTPEPREPGPEFAISAWVPEDGDRGDIDINVAFTDEPDARRHASMGLLYGLAILTLDRNGTLSATIDAILSGGPINEVDAANRIATLMQQDPK